LGLCEPGLRLPMCAMSTENEEKLKKALKDYGLIGTVPAGDCVDSSC